MRWFLRLFSAYRELESSVVNERLAAATAIARVARLEEKLDAKDKEHEDTMRRMVDSYSFAATGRRVFAAASETPLAFPSPAATPPAPRKQFAHDLVQQRVREFMAERAASNTTVHSDPPSLEDLMADAEKAG